MEYIKRDVLLPQILPDDSLTVTVEMDVFVKNTSTTTPIDDSYKIKLINGTAAGVEQLKERVADDEQIQIQTECFCQKNLTQVFD